MQELIGFSAFLYQYIEFITFFKVARRGGYSPPSPPKSTTDYICITLKRIKQGI